MNKELNKKLAEWRGFQQAPNGGYVCDSWETYPSSILLDDLPNFPESLDACFEWLEPELFRRGYRYRLTRLQDGHKMEIIKPNEDDWAEIVASVLEPEASLAFAKAIEQLIDKGE